MIDASAEKITIEEVKKTINNFDIVVMSTSIMSFGEDARYLAELKDTLSPESNATYLARSANNATLDFYDKLQKIK